MGRWELLAEAAGPEVLRRLVSVALDILVELAALVRPIDLVVAAAVPPVAA